MAVIRVCSFALKIFINSLCAGVLPTIPSASDFNTVLSSDQNTLDTHSQHTHSQHSTSQDDLLNQDETNLCPAAVQLADAQVCAPGILHILLSFINDHPYVIAASHSVLHVSLDCLNRLFLSIC